jgi:diguanylate cyclase (GGDEF)-like protein
MFSSLQTESDPRPFIALLKSLHEGIVDVAFFAPGPAPPEAPGQLLLPVRNSTGRLIGSAALTLAPGTDVPSIEARLKPAIDCLAGMLGAANDAVRESDLKLLRLANELDIDFRDDARLDKAVSAVARRLGVELAWLSDPRSQVNVAVRGNDHELDPGVRQELARMRARVAPMMGKLRRPLILNDTTHGKDMPVQCRLLITPLFVGRARHNAWLVLANPFSAPAFGGWHLLAAMTMGQALARRLEVDLDRRTGLFNRGGLEAALPRVKSARASLLVIDIDRLQSVNQMHGMAAGDAAIMAVARLLAPPLLPPGALAARTMGDQFAVVLPDMDTTQAADFGVRLQNAAAKIQPGLPDDPSSMTLTMGLVDIDDTTKPFDRYAIDADTALKLAKDRGRSRIEVYSVGSSTLMRRSDEVLAAADLREGLRTGALLLFAQPIRKLADREAPPGFELLVRLRDEDGELHSPSEFIEAAKRFQLLTDLDRYVTDAALEMLAPHRGLLTRLDSTVSINVSGISLASDEFIENFIGKLRESRIPGGLITLEVTEQSALTNLDRAAASMRRLRELGCGIAIDDFGTGANSLAYLRTLPVTRIKIDGSFVRDVLTNSRSESGIKGIMQLAREYRLDTVAEFVESEAVARRLQMLGIARGQGYLFGKPEPVDLAIEKLGEEERAAVKEIFDQF